MTFEDSFKVLGEIARGYPSGSNEYNALLVAIDAIFFLMNEDAREQFRNFIEQKNSPLNGYDFLHLKYYGLDIPDEMRTPEIIALEPDIDMLVSRIQKLPRM
jgi:hypothetical protein